MSDDIQAVIFSFENTLVRSLEGLISACQSTLDSFCMISGVDRKDIIADLQALSQGDDWEIWHERKQEDFGNVLREHCPSVQKALAEANDTDRGTLNDILDSWDLWRRDQMSLYEDYKKGIDTADIMCALKKSGRKIAIHTDVPLPCTIRLLIENGIEPEDINIIGALQYEEEDAERSDFMQLSDEEQRYLVKLTQEGKVIPIAAKDRKPSPETTLRITKRLGVSPENTLMIGDKHVDWATTQLKGVFNDKVKIPAATPEYDGENVQFGWAEFGTKLTPEMQEFYYEVFSGDRMPIGSEHITSKFNEWGAEPTMKFTSPAQILTKLGVNVPQPRAQGSDDYTPPSSASKHNGPAPK